MLESNLSIHLLLYRNDSRKSMQSREQEGIIGGRGGQNDIRFLFCVRYEMILLAIVSLHSCKSDKTCNVCVKKKKK